MKRETYVKRLITSFKNLTNEEKDTFCKETFLIRDLQGPATGTMSSAKITSAQVDSFPTSEIAELG